MIVQAIPAKGGQGLAAKEIGPGKSLAPNDRLFARQR